MKEKWLKWAVLEAVVRVLSNALQKAVNDLTHVFGTVLYMTAAIGLVQAVLGIIVARFAKEKIKMHPVGLFGSITFGLLAVVAITLSFLVFAKGGQLGVHAFIVTLGIVPGALLDRFLFKHPIRPLQGLGVGIAVLAGYCALDCPSLEETRRLPLWVFLSFAAMLVMTLNQAVSQKIQSYTTPMAKNFWGGLTIFLAAGTALLIIGPHKLQSPDLLRLTKVAVIIGALSVFLWTFNLWAYQGGAFIALKKLVVNGNYIFMGAAGGALFFGERVTLKQFVGFALYGTAFLLVDREAWVFVCTKLNRARTSPLEV